MNNNMKMIMAVMITAIVCIAGTYILVSGSSDKENTLSLKGSTTLQPLVDRYSEEFSEYSNIRLDIQGGGSGVGIAAVINGDADIGMSSRALKGSETDGGLVAVTIGRDAVVVIINDDVAPYITDLSEEQLKGIFDGTYTNWNQVGGPDEAIAPIIREEGSGTRECFDTIVGDMPASNSYSVQASTGGVITQVNQTPGAIGYISLGNLTDSCNPVGYNGYAASVENVQNGSYEMVRPLVLVTKGEPSGASQFFIEWVLGTTGQRILADMGFVPL